MLALYLYIILNSGVHNVDYYEFEPLRVEVPIRSNIEKNIDEISYHFNIKPNELKAIAWVESRFNTKAVSHTGDYGLFQINCNVWWESLRYNSLQHCKESLIDYYPLAIYDAIEIIQFYRQRYKQCKGNKVFYCYNGGPGWQLSNNRKQIEKYHSRVVATLNKLEKERI